MSHFKTTITNKALEVVVRALDQFCEGKPADCSMIQGTPQTALSGMAVGDSYATIPFSAGGTLLTLECFPEEKGQAACHLYQRPTSIFSSFFGATSGAGIWACGTHGSPLISTGKVIGVGDAGPDAGRRPGETADSDDAPFADDAETAPDAVDDVAADACQEFCDADLVDAEEVAFPDAVTEDVAPEVEDTVQDAAADLPEDATLTDVAEDVALPQDATAAVGPDVYDSGICQYFCGVDSLGTPDAVSPTDVTLADATTPTTVGVTSKICNTPISGPLTLSAPLNSVAAACTNDGINALLMGAKGCVAECGFYDNNIFLSTDPTQPVAFALNLFAPPQPPMQPYTITLSLQPPVFSDGYKPGLPGFLGSSFVFAFNQKLYNNVGDIAWDAEDKDSLGNLKGTVRILYQPKDYFFNLPEFLDITYTNSSGSKVSYRYPCDMLQDAQGKPNPIINCTEVK